MVLSEEPVTCEGGKKKGGREAKKEEKKISFPSSRRVFAQTKETMKLTKHPSS